MEHELLLGGGPHLNGGSVELRLRFLLIEHLEPLRELILPRHLFALFELLFRLDLRGGKLHVHLLFLLFEVALRELFEFGYSGVLTGMRGDPEHEFF